MLDLAVAALVGALISSVVSHFAPSIWSRADRRRPLAVHVETDLSRLYAGDPNWVAHFGVVSRDHWPLDPPPTGLCRDWAAWLRPLGAWDGGWTEIRVSLFGRSDVDVVVERLLVTTVTRAEPQGVCVQCPVGGADITPRHLSIDLDWEPGVVSYGGEDEESVPKAFSVKKGEAEQVHIIARAETSAVEWTAELLLLVDGRRETVIIDNDGRPFRTSGYSDLEKFVWTESGWSEQGVL